MFVLKFSMWNALANLNKDSLNFLTVMKLTYNKILRVDCLYKGFGGPGLKEDQISWRMPKYFRLSVDCKSQELVGDKAVDRVGLQCEISSRNSMKKSKKTLKTMDGRGWMSLYLWGWLDPCHHKHAT